MEKKADHTCKHFQLTIYYKTECKGCAEMNLTELKEQVLKYAQQAYTDGLIAGTSGNLSVLSEDGKMVITPSGIHYMTMTAEDVMVIELDGTIVEGSHKPSSEWQMHAEIYKNKPEVRSVVHTHSPYATAFAVLNEPIPPILIEMVYSFKGEVPIAPVASQGTVSVGEGVAKALQNGTACLMQNHGAVTIGQDLPKAYIRAVYLEDAARAYHMARAIGTPTLVPDEMAQEMLARVQ